MPLTAYGVLTAALLDRRPATDRSPHYQLLCAADGVRWRVAINARSALAPSRVAYAVIAPFAHPTLDRLAALPAGWQRLAGQGSGGLGLDYIHANLAPPSAFRPLPLSDAGPDNDLNELFDFHLRPLIGAADARLYAFGAPWPPDPDTGEAKPDEYFGFTPGRGVHDIHQNQGNQGSFVADDGVWQDGGLIVQHDGAWTAILLRFQTQAWHTDDATGHAIQRAPAGEAASADRIGPSRR